MKKPKQEGFTLVEIMIVVMIIGLLAAIALPSFQRARDEAREKLCTNNRRLVESGKDQYAVENHLTSGETVSVENVNNYIKELAGQTEVISCPSQGTIAYQAIDTAPTCSIHAPAPAPRRIMRGTDSQRDRGGLPIGP